MKKLAKSLIAITTILLAISCSKPAQDSNVNNDVVCVKAEMLTETTASLPIQCSGIISSKQMVKLSFKTGGIISSIKVIEGSAVKKGELIATLDMTEISAQVSQANLAFEKAKRDLDRVKNLYADTVATLEQLQDATSAYEAALETKNIAEFNKQYSRITAPANGKIIAKLAEEHELVGPGMPVVVFTQQGIDEWVLKAGVSDKDIVKLNIGDKASVEIDAFPGKNFTAYVSKIAESADPTTGTFEIEVTVNPNGEKFINGLVAKAMVEMVNTRLVTLVPPDAITEADGNKGYVFVVKEIDSTAKKIPVTIAYLENNYIAVIEPVNKIGAVITKGASYLEDGSKVNVSQ